MTHFGLVVFSFVLSLVSSVSTQIEDVFLRNNADGLKTLLEPGAFLNVSISGPVAFSDVLSDEQTVLWFRKFFRFDKTLGFYPDNLTPSSLDRGSFVLKARWEAHNSEGKLIAYDVLFLIRNRFADRAGPIHSPAFSAEDVSRANAGRSGPGFAKDSAKGIWTILQIRAEER
jgi:hypothetical protein